MCCDVKTLVFNLLMCPLCIRETSNWIPCVSRTQRTLTLKVCTDQDIKYAPPHRECQTSSSTCSQRSFVVKVVGVAVLVFLGWSVCENNLATSTKCLRLITAFCHPILSPCVLAEIQNTLLSKLPKMEKGKEINWHISGLFLSLPIAASRPENNRRVILVTYLKSSRDITLPAKMTLKCAVMTTLFFSPSFSPAWFWAAGRSTVVS